MISGRMSCPTECDDDCDADCHEGHYIPHRRQHQPRDCPAAAWMKGVSAEE